MLIPFTFDTEESFKEVIKNMENIPITFCNNGEETVVGNVRSVVDVEWYTETNMCLITVEVIIFGDMDKT